MVKILLLFKAFDIRFALHHNTDITEEYEKLKICQRNLIHSNPNVDVYFVMTNPNLISNSNIQIDEKNNIIWIKTEENYRSSLLIKFMTTIQHIIYNSNKYYNFIIYANTSTYVNLSALLELCETHRFNPFYYGGDDRFDHTYRTDNYYYASGLGIILSYYNCISLLYHWKSTVSKFNDLYDWTDDITIGYILSVLQKIRVNNISTLWIDKYNLNYIDLNTIDKNIVFIRLKELELDQSNLWNQIFHIHKFISH